MRAKILTLSCIALVSIVLFNACDFNKLKDAIDDFKVVVELEPIETSAVVQLLDATTDDLVTGQVKVTFLDENGEPDDNTFIDSYSMAISEVTVTNGFVNFGIRNEIVPTEDNPILVTLLIEKEGYKDRYETIVIEDTGSFNFKSTLLDINNLPEGVQRVERPAGTTSSTGDLLEDVVIDSGSDLDSNMSSKINFRSGIKLFGEDGNPINGSLEASVISYDTFTESGGRFNPVANLIRENTTEVYETFGVTKFMMYNKSSGEFVTNFEPSVLKDGNQSLPSLVFSLNENVLPPNIQLSDFVLRYLLAEDENIYTIEYNTSDWQVLPDEFKNGNTFFRFQVELQNMSELPVVFWVEMPASNYSINATVNITNPSSSSVRPRISYNKNGFIQLPPESRGWPLIQSNSTHTVTFPFNVNERRVELLPACFRLFDCCILCVQHQRTAEIQVTVTYPITPRQYIFNITGDGYEITQSHNFLTQGNVLNVELPGDDGVVLNTGINIDIQCHNQSQKVRVTSIPAATVMYRKVGTTRWYAAGNIEWDYQNLALRGATVRFPRVEQGAEYQFQLLYDTQNVQPSETLVFTEDNEIVNRVLQLSSSQSSSVCD